MWIYNYPDWILCIPITGAQPVSPRSPLPICTLENSYSKHIYGSKYIKQTFHCWKKKSICYKIGNIRIKIAHKHIPLSTNTCIKISVLGFTCILLHEPSPSAQRMDGAHKEKPFHFLFFYSILFVISWTTTEIRMVKSWFCSVWLLHQHQCALFFQQRLLMIWGNSCPIESRYIWKKSSQKMVKANVERQEIQKQIIESFKSICWMPQFQRVWAMQPALA